MRYSIDIKAFPSLERLFFCSSSRAGAAIPFENLLIEFLGERLFYRYFREQEIRLSKSKGLTTLSLTAKRQRLANEVMNQ